jgi:hypothetical protein
MARKSLRGTCKPELCCSGRPYGGWKENRRGRIHRYGQTKEVFIYNMVTKDTNEGRVLDKLFEKLDRMRQALGTDRVFDIIGDIFPDKKLDEILRDAVISQPPIDFDLIIIFLHSRI